MKLHHHPDSLIDRPYTDVEIDFGNYRQYSGELDVISKDNQGITAMWGRGAIRLDACGQNILRIRATPEGIDYKDSPTITYGLINTDLEQGEYFTKEENGVLYFNTRYLKLTINGVTKELKVLDDMGETLIESINGGLRFSSEEPDYSGKRMVCDFKIDNESFFGFGGRIMHPNRTNTTVDVFDVKAGVAKGDYGGCPVPFFISTKGYGFFYNNPWPHVYFDMGKTNSDQWFLHSPGGECDIFLIYGPEFSQIVRTYTDITGKVPFPEKWWFGFWCSSLTFTTAKDALTEALRLREERYPCDVVVLDAPWRAGAKFLEQYTSGAHYDSNDIDWHPDFGDGLEMINKLKENGYKVSLHLNSRSFSEKTAMYGVEKGYLRRHEEETVVRVTDLEAEKYYKNLILPRIAEGTDIWWTDHSDRVSGEIAEGIPSRNLFGALWNRVIVEAMESNGQKSAMCLSRGSGIGGQKYGLMWPGDTGNGIEYFEDDIWYCLNAGLAGFSFTSVDLGGFNLKYGGKNVERYPNVEAVAAEVLEEHNIARRVCQSIFFIPSPRIHNNWCTMPKLPWNCPESTRKLYKDFLEERYRLTPYIYSAAIYSSMTGEPILKPLVYSYRVDEKVYDIGDEFFMGDSLLIAPVTKKEVIYREVYLPEGEWVSLWKDEEFIGPCTINVETPLYSVEGLPVFVKKGSIIPRQPLTQYLEDAVPEELTLDIYMEDRASLVLYESREVVNRFEASVSHEKIYLKLENNTPITRTYIINLHCIKNQYTLEISGGSINSYEEQFELEAEPNSALELSLDFEKALLEV